MVALAVLGIAATAALGLVTQNLRMAADLELRTYAGFVAENLTVQSRNDRVLVLGETSGTVPMGGQTFYWKRVITDTRTVWTQADRSRRFDRSRRPGTGKPRKSESDAMKNDSGFSLVEVLVALFVVSLLSLTGGAMLTTAVNSRTVLLESVEQSDALRRAHGVIRDDLRQWVPRNFIDRTGIDLPTSFAGGGVRDPDILMAFVRDGWTNPGLADDRSGLIAIRYRVANGGLERDVRIAPDGVNGTATFTTRLLEDLADVQISFLSGNRETAVWDARSAGGNGGAPSIVRLVLEREDGSRLDWSFAAGQTR